MKPPMWKALLPLPVTVESTLTISRAQTSGAISFIPGSEPGGSSSTIRY
jgi:hypothetical protein